MYSLGLRVYPMSMDDDIQVSKWNAKRLFQVVAEKCLFRASNMQIINCHRDCGDEN